MPESHLEQQSPIEQQEKSKELRTQELLKEAQTIIKLFERRFWIDSQRVADIKKEYADIQEKHKLAIAGTLPEEQKIAEVEFDAIHEEYLDMVNKSVLANSFRFNVKTAKEPKHKEFIATNVDMFLHSKVSIAEMKHEQIGRLLSGVHALWWDYADQLQMRMASDPEGLAYLAKNWGVKWWIDTKLYYRWKDIAPIVDNLINAIEITFLKKVDTFILSRIPNATPEQVTKIKDDVQLLIVEQQKSFYKILEWMKEWKPWNPSETVRNIMVWIWDILKQSWIEDNKSAAELTSELLKMNELKTRMEVWMFALEAWPQYQAMMASAQGWQEWLMAIMAEHGENSEAQRMFGMIALANCYKDWAEIMKYASQDAGIADKAFQMAAEWKSMDEIHDVVIADATEKWLIEDEQVAEKETEEETDEDEEVATEEATEFVDSRVFVSSLTLWDKKEVPWVTWMDVKFTWEKFEITYNNRSLMCSKENIDSVLDVATVILPNRLDFFLPKLDEIVQNLENTDHKSSLEKLKSNSKEIRDEWSVEVLKLFCAVLFDIWGIREEEHKDVFSRIKEWGEKVKTLNTIHDFNKFLDSFETDVLSVPLREIAKMQWFLKWDEFQTNTFIGAIEKVWATV